MSKIDENAWNEAMRRWPGTMALATSRSAVEAYEAAKAPASDQLETLQSGASNLTIYEPKPYKPDQPVQQPDLVTLIQNAQTEFLLSDEGVAVHDSDIISTHEARAIIAALHPYLRQPDIVIPISEEARAKKVSCSNGLTSPGGSNPRNSRAPTGESNEHNELACAKGSKTTIAAPGLDWDLMQAWHRIKDAMEYYASISLCRLGFASDGSMTTKEVGYLASNCVPDVKKVEAYLRQPKREISGADKHEAAGIIAGEIYRLLPINVTQPEAARVAGEALIVLLERFDIRRKA